MRKLAYRLPPSGRGRDDAELLQPGKGSLERAGDRGGRQSQDVHAVAQAPERLFLPHPEPLLLIDDQQSRLGEAYVLAGQRLGADDDIDAPIGEPGPDGTRLSGRREPGQGGDADAKPGKSSPERLQMLSHQNGRGRYQDDLPAAECGDRGCTQGYLGLAVSDVAADQPVHRPPGCQIPPRPR